MQLITAVAERSKADGEARARRPEGGRAGRARRRAEGSDRWSRPADRSRQTGAEEAEGSQPGEQIEIAAKPASVDLRAGPLAKAKTALRSVQKARRRLAS
jgi:hypothetical protein